MDLTERLTIWSCELLTINVTAASRGVYTKVCDEGMEVDEESHILQIRYYGYREDALDISGPDHADYDGNVEIVYDD